MDDITFGHNGPYGGAWTAEPQPTTASGVAIPGRSLMSMNALFIIIIIVVIDTVIVIILIIIINLSCRWYDVGCLVLKDPRHGVELTTFSQATPVPPECMCVAQDATPSDYPLRWSGLTMSVGQAIQLRAPHVDHTNWHSHVVGMSHGEILSSAARALAGLYRARLVPYDSIL